MQSFLWQKVDLANNHTFSMSLQIVRSPHIKNVFMFFYWLAMVGFFVFIAYMLSGDFFSESCLK